MENAKKLTLLARRRLRLNCPRKTIGNAQHFLLTALACAVFLLFCVVLYTNVSEEDARLKRSIISVSRDEERIESNDVKTSERETDRRKVNKLILFWTQYFGTRGYEFKLGQEGFAETGCPIRNCLLTTDRTLFNVSDAVIFHVNDFDERDLPDPRHRRPHQRFIFYNYETMVEFEDYPMFTQTKHFFNWTMTYRRDSDLYDVRPYGSLRRRTDARLPPSNMPIRLTTDTLPPDPASLMTPSFNRSRNHPILAKKTKMVAWFVSRCHSDSLREEYFELVGQHVPIDIYGGCGPLKCMPSRSEKCDKLLDSYKFYVAAENAICADYVSEKFYRALASDIVPIVYGGADYSAYAPPMSYIDVADFVSPKALADYLKLLHENDGLYLKYFDWKKDYKVVSRPADGWCELCEKLNDPNQLPKVYKDLTDWWFHKDIPCLSGNTYSLLLNQLNQLNVYTISVDIVSYCVRTSTTGCMESFGITTQGEFHVCTLEEQPSVGQLIIYRLPSSHVFP
ncbi:hypothetical protein OUZ56_014393 [Daphnia magna]|uniref:Fucosyltransferase n=1 Tax=Daphnia magna TaxID=35525 RepID=A0ABR0AK08_9CRUS|nr:hypothetical protein OUZ56_014393 [Daphnia magna]